MEALRRGDSHRSSYGALAVWLFLALLTLFTGLTRGHFWSVDEVAVFQQTRSLWEHGDLSVAPSTNTMAGRGGRLYVSFGAGQSVLAWPLYGLGKSVRLALERTGAHTWIRTLAGPEIGPPDRHWGGEVEVFFVNLFGAIAVAALAGVFFAFNLRLGTAPRWALAATLLLALTTHIAGFSGNFFQHGAESLLLLWTFYFLFCDSREPNGRTRMLAGLTAGAMLTVRPSTTVLLPALTAYLFWCLWRGGGKGYRRRLAEALKQCIPFLIPVAAGLLVVAGVNYARFGDFSVRGGYARLIPLTTPLLIGLYGNLFSVGQSIFLFSPLLVLAPVYFGGFARRYRAEAVAIGAMAASSLLLCSRANPWHGQWYFGPRLLVHLVPLLLLPLGYWLQRARRTALLAVAPLALAGLLVQAMHIAVNTSYVYYHEGYLSFKPELGYLFLPQYSQLLAHWRALWAWDGRVDMWLVTVARESGARSLLPIAALLTGILLGCAWRVRVHLRRADAAWAARVPPTFAYAASAGLPVLAGVWLLTIAGLLMDHL